MTDGGHTPCVPSARSERAGTRARRFLTALLLVALSACDDPSLYEMNAREFLETKGVDIEIIERLTMRMPLDGALLGTLARYGNISVLHLVGENPGTPGQLLAQLAGHDSLEVRTGVAVNPNTPLDALLKLRMPGRYTTQNNALARNPALPPSVLLEMYRSGEAGAISLGMNPNSPPELLRSIASGGTELDRSWLATNPGLPEDVARLLADDPSRMVREHLQNNPVYGRLARDVEP